MNIHYLKKKKQTLQNTPKNANKDTDAKAIC